MAVFVHTGTGVSQTTVVNELAGSQVENGKEEAKRIVGAVLDATPIVGHVKGFVHDITGDHQAAERAYEAATRATAVVGAGAGGLLVGGPVTGAALSVTTGATWDVTTALATDGKETPGVASLVTNPGLDTAVSAGISLAGDGLAGFVGAKVVGKLCEKIPKAGITKQLKAVVSEDIRPTESLGVEMIKTEIKNLKSTVISASEECKAAQDCYKYNKDWWNRMFIRVPTLWYPCLNKNSYRENSP